MITVAPEARHIRTRKDVDEIGQACEVGIVIKSDGAVHGFSPVDDAWAPWTGLLPQIIRFLARQHAACREDCPAPRMRWLRTPTDRDGRGQGRRPLVTFTSRAAATVLL